MLSEGSTSQGNTEGQNHRMEAGSISHYSYMLSSWDTQIRTSIRYLENGCFLKILPIGDVRIQRYLEVIAPEGFFEL